MHPAWRTLSIGVAAAAIVGASAATALADRALVIGIDGYADVRLTLGGGSSAHDAAAIAGLLQDSLGYGTADIKVLTNGAATRAAIVDAFDSWLVQGSKKGERIFFYFSGLGYFEPDDSGGAPKEGFVPADGLVGQGLPPAITNLISADEFHALMQKLGDRKVTVVIDAGFSGVVSGSAKPFKNDGSIRAVALGGKTRSIAVEPAAKAQKAAGAPLGADKLGGNVAVFSAAAGGQAPVIADGGGAFTKAFIDSIKDKGADANHNGIVSNEEILAFTRDKSKTACADPSACPLGLTPTLEPATAVVGSPLPEEGHPAEGKLTADQILDFFAKGNTHGVALEMMPPSPVKVGMRDIRFRVTSPTEGNLVLLDLGDDGTLTQLFPNAKYKGGREGHILAGSPIVVPDDYYGIHFNATSPSSGTLIALVTNEPIALPTAVKTRSIEVIPREKAKEEFLPAIVEALDKPADAEKDTATRAVDWSVATLRYEMVR
jgi:hypothetical protein